MANSVWDVGLRSLRLLEVQLKSDTSARLGAASPTSDQIRLPILTRRAGHAFASRILKRMMDVEAAKIQSPKRQLSHLEEISSPKRQRRSYHRNHTLHHKAQTTPPKEPALLDSDAVDKFLVEAIKDVLEEQGLKYNVYDPLIESLALEAFRNAVDECRTMIPVR